jgi:hypothetical protein
VDEADIQLHPRILKPVMPFLGLRRYP